MSSFRRWLMGISISVPLGLAAMAAEAAASGLVPHKADYALKLIKTLPSSNVTDARGKIEYRFEKVCDGWISENRTSISLRDKKGQVHHTAYQFVTWEALDGSRYRFNIRHIMDGVLTEQSSGEARTGDRASAKFKLPEKAELELPGDVMFPTAHLSHLLDQAGKGQMVVAASVFDGSVNNPLTLVNAFIHTAGEKAGIGDGLEKGPFVPVRMAFFPQEQDQEQELAEQPLFELSIDYADNGFTNKIIQDYGDFQVSGSLTSARALPEPNCN